jgi:hypothetical protein
MANKKGSFRKQIDIGGLIMAGLTVADDNAIETMPDLLDASGMGKITLKRRLNELGYEIVHILAIRGKK